MKRYIINVLTVFMMLLFTIQNVQVQAKNNPEENLETSDVEVTQGEIGILSSLLISSYTLSITPSSNGELDVHVEVIGTGYMDKIGVSNLYIQEYNNGIWNTILSTQDFSYNSYKYSNDITVYGVAGRSYRAIAYFYVEDDGDSDTRVKTTNSVVAK